MPSNIWQLDARTARAALWLVPALIFHCSGEHGRAEDVCRSLAECTGYVKEQPCVDSLTDAVDDGRITAAELTRCARCVVDNNAQTQDDRLEDPSNDCNLLSSRDCDRACEQVGIVLQAKTSLGERMRACHDVALACGVADCAHGFGVSGDTLTEQEANDAVVDACVSCIAEVPIPVGAGGAGGAGGGGGQGNEAFEPGRCAQMFERCSASCLGVSPIDKRLTLAHAATVYCSTPSACQLPSAGGATGDDSAPAPSPEAGTGNDGLPDRSDADCVQRFSQLDTQQNRYLSLEARDPHRCLTCLEVSQCSDPCHTQCGSNPGETP